jgi:hypothetical protein
MSTTMIAGNDEVNLEQKSRGAVISLRSRRWDLFALDYAGALEMVQNPPCDFTTDTNDIKAHPACSSHSR